MYKIKKLLSDSSDIKNVGLFVILACVLLQMLGSGAAYRFFGYLNLAIVLIYGAALFSKTPSFKAHHTLYKLLLIPLTFILVHFIAVENVLIIKQIRHIFVALFLALGIWILAKKNPDYIKNNIFTLLLALIFGYVIIQALALWYFKQQYGTTKNPHYLAIYSGLMLIAALYSFFKVNRVLKCVVAVFLLWLGTFILYTSSRPTWIGLILSSFLLLLFINKQARIYSVLSILVVLIGLALTNVGNFSSRSSDLLENLNTEERVVIWQNTWQMQSASTAKQWLLGHGLNSFKTDFKPYSNYHLQNIDFNSPHNFILELLYTSGAIGLALAIAMYWVIYRNLFKLIKSNTRYNSIYLLLLAILTTNLVMVSITLPFFTSYNLNIIGLLVGVLLYLKENNLREMHTK